MDKSISQSIGTEYLKQVTKDFKYTKSLGEKAISQVDETHINWIPDKESNSIAVIVKHLSGNMISRWTDFLHSDGEKPYRNRDDEFVDDINSIEELWSQWEKGWEAVFVAVENLSSEDLLKTVYIRNEPHTVIKAIQRQTSHYAYHIGQIVYIAKQIKSEDWSSLSIPKAKSQDYNKRLFEDN